MPTSGYLWVEGTYLHYIDGSGNERRQEGTAGAASGQTPGYIWIEGDNIHYIDSSGQERILPTSEIGGSHTAGYFWVEGNWVHYIRQGGVEAQWHEDISHSDTAHSDTAHSDSAHSDTAHSDSAHSDTAHSDSAHSDTAHSDSAHQDIHNNSAHSNSAHNNIAHVNTAHSDAGYDDWSEDFPCFLAGTKISMENSSFKRVEDIETGDRVLSFYNKNKLTSASVSKLFSHLVNHYYLLKIENHEVNVTEEHPFYIGEGFKRIKELSIGDKIYILENGKLVPEKIVHKELIKKQVKIYNFKVEESQTYFANGFAVHNKPPEHGDYTDTHSDTAHSDTAHSDTAHSDSAYVDWNDDIAHSDTAHSDGAHSDTAHSDGAHSDTAHSDGAHSDGAHSDSAHSDSAHVDEPALVL